MIGKVELKMTGGPELERAVNDLDSKIAGRLGDAVRSQCCVILAEAKRRPRRG
jgi:hypothetical protein